MSGERKLTTISGAPVADDHNATTAGPRGPMRSFAVMMVPDNAFA